MLSGTLNVCTEEASSGRHHRIRKLITVYSEGSRQRTISYDPKAEKVYYQKPKSIER